MPTDKEAVIFGKQIRGITGRSITWNYVGYLYNIAITLLLTSYIVKHIALAEYGLFQFVMSLSATLYVMDIGLSYLLIQSYIASVQQNQYDRLNDLISTAFITLTALGSVGMLFFAGLAKCLPGPFNIPNEYMGEATAIFLIAALIMLVRLPSIAIEQAFQACHRFDRINQIQLLTCSVNAVLAFAVISLGFHIIALALVQFFTVLLQLMVFAILLPSSIPGACLRTTRFKWELLKPLVRLSGWAFLHNLSMYLFDFLSWSILGSFGSMREAALFGIASKLPRQLWNLVDRGANTLMPSLSSSYSKGDYIKVRDTYLDSQRLIFGALLPFVVIGCLFARPILGIWAGSRYIGAAPAMQWLLIYAMAQAIAYPSDELLYVGGRIKQSAIISISSNIACTVGAVLLVPRYGAAGLASCIAVTQVCINLGWFSWKACKLFDISPISVLRETSRGIGWPSIVLGIEVALIRTMSPRLSAEWICAAAFVSGCVYLGVWWILGVNRRLSREKTNAV